MEWDIIEKGGSTSSADIKISRENFGRRPGNDENSEGFIERPLDTGRYGIQEYKIGTSTMWPDNNARLSDCDSTRTCLHNEFSTWKASGYSEN